MALVRVAAAHASRDEQALRRRLIAARAAAGPAAVEEVLLQAYLFLGFPAAIWAFGVWRAVGGTADGEGSMSPGEPSSAALAEEWERAGEEVCRRVYAENYEKLRRNVRALHGELDRWMIQEGYGKVLSRPALDLVTRELCVVAALAVTSWKPQLHSHMRGALNAGASPPEVEAALEAGLAFGSEENWKGRARALWERVRERHVR
ncbi:MAG: carboxymuconolactone decarboxylase family protein [Gemmatimonadota bacterium]